MVTMYLVRHAEAEGNTDETFQGMIDRKVTEKGMDQLACLAERFRDIPLTAIYTSPLQRARVTAEQLNKYHGLELIEEAELREIHAGDWEGEKWSVLPQKFPETFDLWLHDMPHFQAENGEAMSHVYERMYRVITRIAEENQDGTVAVVSHGCALRNYLSFLMSGSINGLAEVGWSDNTAVSLVEFDDALQPKLVYRNDASHLEGSLSTLAASEWCKTSK